MMLPPSVTLTPRQWELMGHLAEGCNNLEIAARMQITRHTVENYLHQIYNLLEIDQDQVNARVTAARWYWSRRDRVRRRYTVETGEFPLIIEVRNE